MSTDLVRIPFHGSELQAMLRQGEGHLVLRPACEDLGLDFSGQLQRLKRQPWAGVVMMPIPSAGGVQEAACLHVDSVPMWLATIQTSRVRKERRELLIAYQKECARVLRNHFLGADPAQVPQLRAEVFALHEKVNGLQRQLGSGVIGEAAAKAFIRAPICRIALYETLERRTGLSHWRKKTEERVRRAVKHHRDWRLLPREKLGEAQGIIDDLLCEAKEGAAQRNADRQQNLRGVEGVRGNA